MLRRYRTTLAALLGLGLLAGCVGMESRRYFQWAMQDRDTAVAVMTAVDQAHAAGKVTREVWQGTRDRYQMMSDAQEAHLQALMTGEETKMTYTNQQSALRALVSYAAEHGVVVEYAR